MHSETPSRRLLLFGIIGVGIVVFGVITLAVLLSDDDAETSNTTNSNSSNVDRITANSQWTPVEQEFNGVTMVQVPPGCFTMGRDDGGSSERPAHQQCLDEPFWIDQTEMTHAMYDECVAAGSCNEPRRAGIFRTDQPLETLRWSEAQTYCAWRGGRLPTEVEWEYAARGPDGLAYPWGNEFEPDYVVYGLNSGDQPAVVGSKPDGASWVGALDMSGNVWEWVSSKNQEYPYDANDGREAVDDSDDERLARGGSYLFIDNSDEGEYVRTELRLGGHPRFRYHGVRCARDYSDDDLD